VAKVAYESPWTGHYNTDGSQKMMLSEEGYIIALWALLSAIIVGPIMFKKVLGTEMSKYRKKNPANIRAMRVSVSGTHNLMDKNDIVDAVEHVLHEHHLDMHNFDRHEDTREGHEGDEEEVFEVKVGGKRAENLNEDELEEIQHAIVDAVNDHHAEITCSPVKTKSSPGLIPVKQPTKDPSEESMTLEDGKKESKTDREGGASTTDEPPKTKQGRLARLSHSSKKVFGFHGQEVKRHGRKVRIGTHHKR